MEAGEGDELELVAHGGEVFLEGVDLGLGEFGAPVEGGGTVVGEELAGELGVDGGGELFGFGYVGFGGLAPDDVGVGGVGEAAGDGAVDTTVDAAEAFDGALAGDEGRVDGVAVGGDELGAVGVGAGYEEGGDAEDVGGQACGDELLDGLAGGDEDLAAHVAALFCGGELVFEVDSCGTGFDHGLHELEGVEGSTEAGLGVGDDGEHPVDVVALFGVMDLVGAEEGVVDGLDDGGDAVDGVEALVGVHLAAGIGVGRDLPAGEVDGLEAGLGHLDSLVAGEGAEGGDVAGLVEVLPEALCSGTGERVFDVYRAAEGVDVFGDVAALDAGPAG